MRVSVLSAPWTLAGPEDCVADGGVLVEGGRIRRLLRSRAAVRRAARAAGVVAAELDGSLTPGLIDAHAHLELSHLAGRVSPAGGFRAWIDGLLRARGAPRARVQGGAQSAADALLASGTTAVGDVDSSGAGEGVLARHALRARVYREVLDAADPARTAAACARVARRLPRRALRLEGLSAHAPFTVSPALFARIADLARRRDVPVAIHWSETEAELDWLQHGAGELAGLVASWPARSGLDLIEAAGLLGPSTSLVHGNHPQRGEIARLARAGATLVHCPGSHRFFDRAPFPIGRYLSAGVPLALGTDSLASNETLDMRREMALLRAEHPSLDPARVWAMATEGGARAIGLAERVGRLAPGRLADLALFRTTARGRAALLDELTASSPAVGGVWVAGRRIGTGRLRRRVP